MNKRKKSRVIWTDDVHEQFGDIEEIRTYLKEQYIGINVNDDYQVYECMYELNSEYLQDEMHNLDIVLDNNIICIADLGLWNGRKQGYKLLNSNLNSIFDIELTKIYYDGFNIRAVNSHHDGTNYMLFRKIKPNVNIDKFLNKIYNGEEISNSMLNYYTKSLKEDFKKAYGI